VTKQLFPSFSRLCLFLQLQKLCPDSQSDTSVNHRIIMQMQKKMQVMRIRSQLLRKEMQKGTGLNVLIGAMCVISRSAAGAIWSYMSLYIMDSIVILVMCVGNSSCHRVVWKYINAFTVENVLFLVVCVGNSLWHWVIWKYINAFTVENVLFLVVCVSSLSISRLICRNTCTLIVVSVHFLVMCVGEHLCHWVIWKYINAFTL